MNLMGYISLFPCRQCLIANGDGDSDPEQQKHITIGHGSIFSLFIFLMKKEFRKGIFTVRF